MFENGSGINKEQIGFDVKYKGAETYSANGCVVNAQGVARDVMLYYTSQIDYRFGYQIDGDERTDMLIVPLRYGELRNIEKKDKNLSAVCFYCRGKGVDSAGRDANFRSILIVEENVAMGLVEKVKNNPEYAYELMKFANNGENIKDYKGEAARINPGKNVRILDNYRIGGKIDKKIESLEFKEGFIANR